MRNETPIVVLKFGSSVLQSELIYLLRFSRFIAGGRKDTKSSPLCQPSAIQLMSWTRRAHTVCNQPDDLLLAALLATGEAASSALLGLSLNRAGIPATVLDAPAGGTLYLRTNAELQTDCS